MTYFGDIFVTVYDGTDDDDDDDVLPVGTLNLFCLFKLDNSFFFLHFAFTYTRRT